MSIYSHSNVVKIATKALNKDVSKTKPEEIQIIKTSFGKIYSTLKKSFIAYTGADL
jgi:hypothetical protein